MTKSSLFKWRHYEAQIILSCVRWYLSYPLSYSQVAEMVNEWGMENMMRKGKTKGVEKGSVKQRVFFINQIFGIAA